MSEEIKTDAVAAASDYFSEIDDEREGDKYDIMKELEIGTLCDDFMGMAYIGLHELLEQLVYLPSKVRGTLLEKLDEEFPSLSSFVGKLLEKRKYHLYKRQIQRENRAEG